MEPHLHVSFIDFFITMLYVVVGLGAINIVARRNEGKAWADSLLEFLP